jgi:hypothetical protein
MIGHQPLIAMRRAGFVPRSVCINTRQAATARDWHRWTPEQADIYLAPDEPLHRLDLRFVVGLNVDFIVDNDELAERLFDALVKAGAKRVIGAVVVVEGPWKEHQTVRMLDSQGGFTWQRS